MPTAAAPLQNAEDDGAWLLQCAAAAERAEKEIGRPAQGSENISPVPSMGRKGGGGITFSAKASGGPKKTAPKKKAKVKAKKDPNAPKRGTTSFVFFSREVRPALVLENNARPEGERISFGDLAKKLGAMWKELTPERKVPYEQLAAADKERYAEAMKTYVVTPPEYEREPASVGVLSLLESCPHTAV